MGWAMLCYATMAVFAMGVARAVGVAGTREGRRINRATNRKEVALSVLVSRYYYTR